jgi:hypothetical protein
VSELSPEARALFHAARRAGAPPADAQARIRDALRAQAARPVAKASAAHVAAKLLSAVLLAVGATWGVARSVTTRPSPPTLASASPPAPRVVPRAPAEALPAPPPPASSPAPGVAAQAPRPRIPAPRPMAPRPRAPLASTAVVVPPARPVEAPPAPSPSLGVAEEVRLVSAARGALREHDGARALGALDEHQRRFPRGVLAQESSAVRVLALCEVGREDEARALARTWFASSGNSPLAANLRRSCAGDAR